MVPVAVTVFLCICCWLHGATVGIAIGDSIEVYKFFILTFSIVILIWIMWFTNPESKRISASLTYLVCTIFLTSLVKSIAWFRTPRLEHWTALPDIGHDLLNNSLLNSTIIMVPYINHPISTYHLPKDLLLPLVIATGLFIFFHKQRNIILRRILMIYSTLMLVRAILAISTYLPDSNPSCSNNSLRFPKFNVREVVRRFFQSLAPALVSGGSGCRDIIFCGHTIMMVLCAMIWHTYYKRVKETLNSVKLIVWSYIAFVVLFSLAQKQMYTLDAVLSTYFTITVWATYHRLTNDVLTGHSFSSVWLIDKMLIYPIIEWMESAVEDEKNQLDLENKICLYKRDDNISPTRNNNEKYNGVNCINVIETKQRSTFRTSEY